MANTFKNSWKEDIATSAADVYTAPASTESILIGMTLSNTTAGNITATVTVYDADTGLTSPNDTNSIVYLNAVNIPPNTALEVMRGNKLVLEAGDKVQIHASAASSLNAFLSVLEIS